MKHRSLLALAVAIFIGSVGVACASDTNPIGGEIIAPVTMSVNELQGEEIDLLVGQVLNINTDSLDVDSYTGQSSDTEVAEFVEGRKDDSAEFNPGVTAVSPGRAEITMVNAQAGIQPLSFTVNVTAG